MPTVGLTLYERSLFSSMFLLAFYFGLRVGEITSSPHNLDVGQIVMSGDSIQLSFSSFKHSKDYSPIHTVQTQHKQFCPVLALNQYLEMRGKSQGFLFILHGRPIARNAFSSLFKQLLSIAGESASLYKAHSFRIGAASYWAALGFSDTQIRRLGRWHSNAGWGYIRGQISHPIE